MTDHTPAAQAAMQDAVHRVLEPYAESYDTMTRLAEREGRRPTVSTTAVSIDIRGNMIPGLLDALSKLRAPVADERAARAEYDRGFSNGWDYGNKHGREQGFNGGVCVALQVITTHDQGTIWSDIVRACDTRKMLDYAANVEPDEWELAGFKKYARLELNERKPRKRHVPASPLASAPVADERAAFEAARQKRDADARLGRMCLVNNDEYSNSEDQAAWEGWQDRAALASAPVAVETVAWEEVRDALAILLSGATGKASKHWIAPLEDATASGPLAKMRACLAAPQARKAVPGCLLAAEHVGMTVDYTGLLGQARGALTHGEAAPALAEMLRQLAVHLKELGQRWYAGDAAVVDEFLQLYCIESDTRAALSAQPSEQMKGGSDAQ